MPTVRAGDLPYQPYNSEEPSPQVPSAYQNIRSTGADFGETIGTATEKLGATIGQGANVLAEGAIARQQLENQVRADDQTNKYQEAVTKLLHGDPDNPTDTGFLGKRGEDAMRDYNSTYKSIVDLRNTMRGQLANDRQRLAFDNESRRTQILTLSRMGEHYDREFKTYGTAVNHAAALGGMTQAADAQANGDQAGFSAGVAKRMTADLKQAQLMGVANNPDVVNNILRNARSDVTKLQFKDLSETNPYKAWQFLEVNKDALEPGELHTLRQGIAAKYYDLRGKIDAKEMPAPEGWDSKAPIGRSGGIGNPEQTGQGHVVPKAERLAYYKQKAAELGLNYNAIVSTVANEGLNIYTGDNGTSFGDFQLHTGGGSMGDAAVAAGINIQDPKTWKQQADFALQQMVAHKGDAEWFNSQWHGPRANAPKAAYSFGNPDQSSTSETDLRKQYDKTAARQKNPETFEAYKARFAEPGGSSIPPEAYVEEGGGGGDTGEGSGGSSPDPMVGTPNKIPGLKYAPIEPPEPGQLPDAQIPGLSERIAEIAKEPWAKDDPVRMNAAIKAARQGANIRWTESQRELRLHQERMKAQGDAVDDSYMKRMYPGSPNPPSVQEVQQDKRLDMHPDVRRKIISFMERENKLDPVAQVSKGNTMELYRRMTLPDGAEGKFTNEQPIEQAYIGQQVTRQDHDWLIKEFRDQRSAGNENLKDLKNRMITAAKPTILGPLAAADERLIEPNAAIKLFGYTEAINNKIKEYQDAGKNPADLFKTSSPDFVGSPEFIQPYASAMGERMRQKAHERDMGITPGGPPIPPPMGIPPAPPPDFSKVSNEDLIMGINSKKIDAGAGIKELERRGYGRRAAPPVAPAPSTGMR